MVCYKYVFWGTLSIGKALLDYCCSQTVRKWGIFYIFSFNNGEADLKVKRKKKRSGQLFSSLLLLRVNVHSAAVAYSPPGTSLHLMFWAAPPTERCGTTSTIHSSKRYCFEPSCIVMRTPSTRAIRSVLLSLPKSLLSCFAGRWQPFPAVLEGFWKISLHYWRWFWYKVVVGI